jgi:hypothetical protein
MMTAQNLLGKINATKKYSVLYLSTMEQKTTQRFWSTGTYRHHSCFTELMPKELVKSMMDVVSHEFFHIVTPA